jgi:poly(ADP-ribose) glycohydrolase
MTSHERFIYPLPSHPSQTCVDRFSLLPDSEEAEVSVWSIIQTLLTSRNPSSSPSDLGDLLDTLSLSIHRTRCTDHVTLLEAIERLPSIIEQVFPHGYPIEYLSWETVLAQVLDVAFELPTHFPSGVLPVLSTAHPSITLKPRQVTCLLAHMFLGTLSRQPWAKPNRSHAYSSESGTDEAGAVGFSSWFPDNQAAPHAVEPYLTALLAFFIRLSTPPDTDEKRIIEYSLQSTPLPPFGHSSWSIPLSSIEVELVSSFTTDQPYLALPDGACVIMANKNPGFGSSATQEEIHVGSTSEACIVSLLCPPLADTQVLVVRGAEPMVVIDGYGRGARLQRVLSNDEAKECGKGRTMLFMDALELDGYDTTTVSSLPDLLPGNVRRELQKAYCAFTSGDEKCRYPLVVTGLWGCGAFGGDKSVKTLVQWCAAALTGTRLKLVLEEKMRAFADELRRFGEEVMRAGITVGQVVSVLENLKPEEVKRDDVLGHVLDKLDIHMQ